MTSNREIKIFAHYFTGRGRKFVCFTLTSPALSNGVLDEINVSGKAEARKIAAERGAVCWNF